MDGWAADIQAGNHAEDFNLAIGRLKSHGTAFHVV
jgi:hypothetical protein